nr:DUF364 domain-containing protein [Actinomyces sp. 186855]
MGDLRRPHRRPPDRRHGHRLAPRPAVDARVLQRLPAHGRRSGHGHRLDDAGHLPFARTALPTAAEVQVLERSLRPDDYPDTACKYLLPEADYVFISSSSLVNKTAPRLVALAADGGAHVVMVGPSTPLHPLWLEMGVETVTGWVPDAGIRPDRPQSLPADGTIGAGTRVHLGLAPGQQRQAL